MRRVKGETEARQRDLMKRKSATPVKKSIRLKTLSGRSGKPRPIQILVSPEMHSALREYCTVHHVPLSDLVRNCVLHKIGRKDLIGTLRAVGRPRH